MATKKGAFKNKGTGILKKPASMDEFLKDMADEPTHQARPEEKESVNTQLHISTNAPPEDNMQREEIERVHIHIRSDLADLVHNEIRKRKKERNGKKATRRAVIEDALESYLS